MSNDSSTIQNDMLDNSSSETEVTKNPSHVDNAVSQNIKEEADDQIHEHEIIESKLSNLLDFEFVNMKVKVEVANMIDESYNICTENSMHNINSIKKEKCTKTKNCNILNSCDNDNTATLNTLKKHQLFHNSRKNLVADALLKQFKCKICSKTFTSSLNLKIHERIHTGEKPFKCHTCFKTFRQSANLKEHERIHTGSKPFKCNICLKTFNSSSAVTKHERIHTGEKPFKCRTCSKTFRVSTDLKVHERIHTGEKPFKCTICFKTYNQPSTLKRHQLIHTGEKPFECGICFKSFNQLPNLKRHEKIHTNQKSFKCTK